MAEWVSVLRHYIRFAMLSVEAPWVTPLRLINHFMKLFFIFKFK